MIRYDMIWYDVIWYDIFLMFVFLIWLTLIDPHWCILNSSPPRKEYPLVIKHGNGESPMNGRFRRKITDKWSSFQHAMFDYRRVYPHKIPFNFHFIWFSDGFPIVFPWFSYMMIWKTHGDRPLQQQPTEAFLGILLGCKTVSCGYLT